MPKFKEKCKRISTKLEQWLTFIINENLEEISMMDNKYIQKAVYNLEKSGNINKDKNAAHDYFMYSRMLFEHNQIGDYLGYKELDARAQNAVDIQAQQVKSIRDKLKEIFLSLHPNTSNTSGLSNADNQKTLGYEIKDDFDLSKAADYELAEDTLKTYKQGYMRSLENLI